MKKKIYSRDVYPRTIMINGMLYSVDKIVTAKLKSFSDGTTYLYLQYTSGNYDEIRMKSKSDADKYMKNIQNLIEHLR